MPLSKTRSQVTSAAIVALLTSAAIYAQSPEGQVPAPGAQVPPFMQASPILSALDVNHDGKIDASELANAPARLKTLDKNGDGKLTRDEAGLPAGFGRGPGAPGGRGGRGEGGRAEVGRGDAGRGGEARGDERNFEVPIPGPTAEELLATLLAWDKNKDGQLQKAEIPERQQQGLLDRGDTDKNGVLDAAELKKLTADQAAAPPVPPAPRGPGRGGFGGPDLASGALDTDRNGEISAEEIANASTSLKALDRNGDGSITEDEVRPMPGGGRG